MRRKADGAKDLVKVFVGKWRDSEDVVGDITHSEMKGGLVVMRLAGSSGRLHGCVKKATVAYCAGGCSEHKRWGLRSQPYRVWCQCLHFKLANASDVFVFPISPP